MVGYIKRDSALLRTLPPIRFSNPTLGVWTAGDVWDSTHTVLNWSKISIETMGLAEQTAFDSAALYVDMAAGMGFSQEVQIWIKCLTVDKIFLYMRIDFAK